MSKQSIEHSPERPNRQKNNKEKAHRDWRGRVWLDQVYFGIDGLRRYGFNAEADILVSRLLENSEGLLGAEPIRENYNPESGAMQGATNFSWSAAHLLLMLRN